MYWYSRTLPGKSYLCRAAKGKMAAAQETLILKENIKITTTNKQTN
jgi:hypothetical protein